MLLQDMMIIMPSLTMQRRLLHRICNLSGPNFNYIFYHPTILIFLLTGDDAWIWWSGGAMVLGKLPVPGRPTIWITVGQGPTALAVCAGGGCLDILLSSIFYFLFLPLFGRRPFID